MTSEASPAAAPDHELSLEGVRNFRDLGGYETTDGRRLRAGQVYRSGALHWLTDADRATLERLGLRVVYDLRTAEERDQAPSSLPTGIRHELLPIGGTAARTRELWELVVGGQLTEVPPDFLFRVYESLAEAAASTYGQLFTQLAAPEGAPGLIHCTAGKDRTGIGVALLLSTLGVDEETILDDYELSAVVYSDEQIAKLRTKLEGTGIDVERYRAIFGAPREAMAAFLENLRGRYGSAEGYLYEEAGVDVEALAELRYRLVEAPDAD